LSNIKPLEVAQSANLADTNRLMLTPCSAASVARVELLIEELLGMFKATGLYVEITIDI